MKAQSFAVPALSAALFFGVGCAHEPKTRVGTAETTSYTQPAPAQRALTPRAFNALKAPNVTVSMDIARACNIYFDAVNQAPKFEFDDSSLQPEDETVLQQVATCVTTGPLRGRPIKLIGRADPRGEEEYNFSLGERRASTVGGYLMQLGVDQDKITETSRGKLDATGTDEDTWQRDRRVDIVLE